MITGNIPTFIAIIIMVGGAFWGILEWRYRGILDNKDSEISLLRSQRDDYREKLNGATPEEARKKIEALEHAVRLTIGDQWYPLTVEQQRALTTKLSSIPKSRASIMYQNSLGKNLAQSIFDAFRAAGWSEVELTTGSGLGEGIVTGWSTRALQIGNAITEVRPDIPVQIKDQEKEIPDLVVVGVGINATAKN